MVQQPRRKLLRLPGFDYHQPGADFFTSVIQHRELLLGRISSGEMMISDAGKIVHKARFDLPHHYPHVVLDGFIVMPNHVHGIIFLEETSFDLGRGGSVEFIPQALQSSDPPLPGMARYGLPEIIRALKSFSARRINLMRGMPGKPVWQRNYYEHIIRDQNGLEQIQRYILGNIALWEQDQFFQEQ